MSSPAGDRESFFELRLESIPDAVVAAIEVRDAWRKQVASRSDGLEFMVSDLARWRPGPAVRVAFLGGDAELHGKIADATRQITDACNVVLDFGLDEATGEYRKWTESDAAYAAEIRVSFDMDGYFSLVGTDSTDRTIAPAGSSVGGRPGQRSLNLGGFADSLPSRWQGTVRHEFLHALGFHHTHQNMRGPCEAQFRWEDDPGYVPTQNADGMFLPDAAGRSPGIYTFLAGAPNHWPRPKVDHNLRTEESPELVVGPFDPKSVMLYPFAPFFYKSNPSPCAPTGNRIDLSDGDKRGLQLLYPGTAADLSDITARAKQALERIGAGQEAGGGTSSPYQDRVIELLNARADDEG